MDLIKPQEALGDAHNRAGRLAYEISLAIRHQGKFVRGGLETGNAAWMEVELPGDCRVSDALLAALRILFREQGWLTVMTRVVPHGTRGSNTLFCLYFDEGLRV